MTFLAGNEQVGPLIWRKQGENDWLHICHGKGTWRIGHYRNTTEPSLNATEALFKGGGPDMNAPPVGITWEPCAGNSSGQAPVTEWEINTAAPAMPVGEDRA